MCHEIMSKQDNLVEKKLRGSGGYIIAKVNDNEQKMANLGGPELFLAGIGRLDEERFVKYHCNRCEKDYQGAPNITFETPNEDLGENIILKEKGEYKCKSCNYIISQYRKFKDLKENKEPLSRKIELDSQVKEDKGKEDAKYKENKKNKIETNFSIINTDYIPIEEIIGIPTYDNNAQLVGKVNEIGLRKSLKGKIQFGFKILNLNGEVKEISWDDISKIGDIIILREKNLENEENKITTVNEQKDNKNNKLTNQNIRICNNCGHDNEIGSIFCEECGEKLG